MRRLEGAAEILKPIETFFDDIDAGSVTEPDRAIITERGAGNDGYIRFAQQAVGEILRSQSKLADVDQNVERALRFHCTDVRDFRQAIDHVIAAHIKLFPHVSD